MVAGQVAVGQRSETVRRANLSAIVRELHDHGPRSRSGLVARTGLTRSAIRGLIGELVAAELATEERAAPLGTPGRPSPLVRLDADGAAVLALEIAVDTLAVALVGLGGEIFELVRMDRDRDRNLVDDVAADLAGLVESVRSRRSDDLPIVGAGVSIVGIVRRIDGLVSFAPNLGWIDVPLGDRVAAALDLPVPIRVANDADLGALAESRRGAAMGAGNVLFVSAEVGIGGGLIVDGRPLTGVAGYGGEVGHIPVNPRGVACRCGAVGCWETETGAEALLRHAGRPIDGGRTELDRVIRDAEIGVPTAVAAVDEVTGWLAFGLAGLINVFNPRLVVLGGMFGRIHPLIAETLDGELDRRVLAGPRRLVRVVPAALGIDAPLVGAAELAFEPLLADPAAWLTLDRSSVPSTRRVVA